MVRIGSSVFSLSRRAPRGFRWALFAAFSLMTWALPGAPLRIVTEDWPPFNYQEKGRAAGLAVDLLRDAMGRMGTVPAISFLPWERAYDLALLETNLLIFTMARRPERESLFIWGPAIYRQRIHLFKMKTRTDVVVRVLEDAKRYRIGTAGENDAGTLALLALGFSKTKNLDMVYTSDQQNIRKLQSGRIDLMVAPEIQIPYTARGAGVDPSLLEATVPLPGDTVYHFAFSRGTDKAIVGGFKAACDAMVDDGTYGRILARYTQP